MTDTLTGRDLDRAVASVLYGHEVQPNRAVHADGTEIQFPAIVPAYSAADFSGFAPVVAWLVAHAPTREEAERLWPEADYVPSLCFMSGESSWGAGFQSTIRGESAVFFPHEAPTLPEAGCRLLVAWAGRVT